jgi:hypothetical protein
MGKRRDQILIEKSRPFMTPGDQVEVIALGRLKQSKRATVGVTAASVVATAAVMAAGGVVGAIVYRKTPVYLVLTTDQLLVFHVNGSTGGPGRHLGAIARTSLRCTEPRGGMFVKVTLTSDGMAPLKLVGAPIPPSIHVRIRELAAALPRPEQTSI